MSLIRKIAAAVLVCFAGGFLFCQSAWAAYGSGLDKYPQKISKTQFTELAKAKIKEQLKNYGEARRQDIMLTKQPADMRCPKGKIDLRVHIPREIRYGGITPVYVTVMVDGNVFRRQICYYRVTVWDKVLVAAHDLPLNKNLVPDDFRVEEKEITDRNDEYLTDAAQTAGKVPGRVIHAGTAITANLLQSPIIVEVGSPIILVINRGGIEAAVEGVALSRGRKGSIIRVRNNKSRKTMRAKVMDSERAKVL